MSEGGTGRFVPVRGLRYYVEETPAAGAGPPVAGHATPTARGTAPAGATGANGARSGRDGREEPAVLLHGFTGSTATWDPVRVELARYGPLLAVDLIGHGRTDAPPDPARYRMEECVADLLALFDRLGLRRVHLVGYSMGGRVALSLAVAAPGRVASLVLESASPGLADPAERERRRQQDEALARRIEEEGLEAFVRYWESLPLFASQQRLPAEVRARVRAGRLAQRPHGLAGSLRGMGAGVQPPVWDRLGGLDLPVLYLAGELDAKYAAMGREVVSRLPRGRLVIVPGAGHTVHLERPAEFAREVGAFWSEVRGVTP